MLPTPSMHPSRTHRGPPPPTNMIEAYRVGLILRGITAAFLLSYAWQFSGRVWPYAWALSAGFILWDGLAAMAYAAWSHRLSTLVAITLIVDGGWGAGLLWAFSQSLHSMVPALLLLYAIEVLLYYRHRCGAVWAGSYLIFANGLMGIVPGMHAQPLWPLPTVLDWIVTDGLVWIGLLLLGGVSLWEPTLTILTPREREVYVLSQAGFAIGEIAAKLHIEPSTVKSHLMHIHRKLGSYARKN